MSRLITQLSTWLAFIVFASCAPLALQAQDTATAKPTAHSAMHVTGCLQKGDEAGGLTITGEDGKVWEVHSSKTNLAEHVGHKVTLTGHVEHKTKMQEAKLEKHETKESGGKPYGDFSVSSLKMVSESCQ